MRNRFIGMSLSAVVLTALALTAGLVPGQPPLPPPAQGGAAANGNGEEVLARGPVHEAYADTYAQSAATPLVPKMPPDGIDELPPDHKPDGANVQWIPGYWHFDEDRNDYMWISGFWRSVPPGRVWVAGSWRSVSDPQGQPAWQWAPGFWQEAAVQQAAAVQAAPQQEVQYLPQPHASIEAGPATPAPTASSFYMPGGWVWRDGRYLWRPGTWYEYRPGWVWVPGYYRWTPIGYVSVEGYWDYPLANRGIIYAPIGYTEAVYMRPGYVYTPTYVVSDQCMMGAMFVRPGWGCYYFGDYYGPRYATVGYSAWCGSPGPNGFVVGFGVGRGWGYDPLWSYYSVAYRDSPRWREGMGALYVGRFNGTVPPPPITLVQQTVIINRYAPNVRDVPGGMTVVGGSITVGGVNVSGMAMVAPTRLVVDMHPGMRIAPLPPEARQRERMAAREVRAAAAARMQRENEVVRRGGGIPRNASEVRSIKHEVSHAAVAHAQGHDEHRAPPPSPHKAAAAAEHVNAPGHGIAGPAEHPGGAPKLEPKGPAAPPKLPLAPGRTDPRLDPKRDPKTEPKRDPKDSRGEGRP